MATCNKGDGSLKRTDADDSGSARGKNKGPDTRKTFVDHLYHALENKGIETYKDDEKIKQGKMIRDELIKAIEDTKFYFIVFSKNYASSSWCLEELVKIMECRKGFGHTAYPVFYDVEPTEVRKQCGIKRIKRMELLGNGGRL
ncbi:Toll/interleukin-1 receptor domain-containing protein [Tanacetum coccineum]